MNDTIALLHSHRSDRDFTDQPISSDMLDAIIQSAWRAPTSINTQQISLVVVRDAERRAKISQITGGQPWVAKAPVFITVIIDHHKTSQAVERAGQEQVIHNSVEGLVSATTDAGIALTSLLVAARSLGLGAVPIGGIRRDPQAMIELLGLPPRTFPVVGLSIGHINTAAQQKPRLPIESFCHQERYDPAALGHVIDQYDETLVQYWQDLKRADGLPWTANTAKFYSQIYFPQTKPVSAQQGFTNEQ